MWERYGVDFVHEDGQWRILHIETITDFAYPFGGDLQSHMPGAPEKSGSEGAKPSPGPGADGLDVPGPTIARAMGESYSPTRVPRLTPRLPAPYRTASETFQYADCRTPVAVADGPPLSGDPSRNPDMTGFAGEVDTNHDGRMSRAEWQRKGLPQSSFGMFEKGRGYVTLEDYQRNAAPAGIDLDGNGKLSVEEFKAFDRRMSAGQPSAP